MQTNTICMNSLNAKMPHSVSSLSSLTTASEVLCNTSMLLQSTSNRMNISHGNWLLPSCTLWSVIKILWWSSQITIKWLSNLLSTHLYLLLSKTIVSSGMTTLRLHQSTWEIRRRWKLIGARWKNRCFARKSPSITIKCLLPSLKNTSKWICNRLDQPWCMFPSSLHSTWN